MLDRRLRNRYSRQTIFPPIGESGQVKLGSGKAVIIGCGALGSNIANLLVRAGVGKVKIIDRDFIEIHNLQRQVLFTEEDIEVGLPKAIAAQKHLSKVNSAVEVEGIVADVNFSNIEELCAGADVILDGLDNLQTRLLINDVSLKSKIPWVYGGAIASNGMTMTIIPGKTACFRCFSGGIPENDLAQTCETAGVIGTVPAVIGALQATEAIKILVGADINRNLIVVDVWNNDFQRFKVAQNQNCPACRGKYEFLENKFEIKITSLCGQSRAVQVVNTKIGRIDLARLAEKLSKAGNVSFNEFMLQFKSGEDDIVVFPDGRAIVNNTIDNNRALELYSRYIDTL